MVDAPIIGVPERLKEERGLAETGKLHDDGSQSVGAEPGRLPKGQKLKE